MPKPTFAQRLDALASLREPIRAQLYHYVQKRDVAVSRDEAAEAVGISRAMAAFHLDKLVDLGLLRADYRRISGRSGRGAGRPAKLYHRTRREFAVTLPERNHELLARLLSESMSGSDDSAFRRRGVSIRAVARSTNPAPDLTSDVCPAPGRLRRGGIGRSRS